MLTAKQPSHYGYKPAHDLPTPPSTSRLSPPLAYQDLHRPRLPSIPRSHSPLDQQMAAPHRGLPLPAAMTLPPQQQQQQHHHHQGNVPPPPPPVPSSIPQVTSHQSHVLSQMPGPPPQWQGAEESMRAWLMAKAEEERRRQEEEKTKQESYRLEQRKLEVEMLKTSLDKGIPPPIVPLVFAGMGGALSEAALDVAKQYLSSQQPGQPQQLMAIHAQRSPEHRRDSQSQGYAPYAPVPSTPGSAAGPQGYITYPGSPTTRGRAHTMSSTGSTGRMAGPTSHLPSINTSTAQGASSHHSHQMGQQQPPPQHQHQQQASSAQQESQASPGIFFHHWQPPTSHAGGPSQTASASAGESPRNKRKATGPPEQAPAPSQQRLKSPSALDSGRSSRNASPERRRGHSRQRSDVSLYRATGGQRRGESTGPARAMSPLAMAPGSAASAAQVPRSIGGHSVSSLLSEEPSRTSPYLPRPPADVR
ncbi:hypothetical protein F5X68DRAFT_35352 [Plectosphaerella plurivora]|uniref:Uncharacterized protein n=1 Tax=Plectosphaerella plurivora TaxID=936078 RepID=A0A9P9A614_9PEZI|nr:hypothetical protein F5X68DRAFT_35352 [Plectosphaerella plurivora]